MIYGHYGPPASVLRALLRPIARNLRPCHIVPSKLYELVACTNLAARKASSASKSTFSLILRARYEIRARFLRALRATCVNDTCELLVTACYLRAIYERHGLLTCQLRYTCMGVTCEARG